MFFINGKIYLLYLEECLIVKRAFKVNDWDIKDRFKSNITYEYQGKELRFDDVGNIHYGYVGRTMFPLTILQQAGGLLSTIQYGPRGDISSYFDEPRDQEMVAYGYYLWDREN